MEQSIAPFAAGNFLPRSALKEVERSYSTNSISLGVFYYTQQWSSVAMLSIQQIIL